MKLLLVPALALLATLAIAPAPSQAHEATCGFPYAHCLAQCTVTSHLGTVGPHSCTREDASKSDPEASGPVRVQRCPESNQYEVHVLGRRVVSCTH